MGQKTHPVGFRIGITRGWSSNWFSRKKAPEYILEDRNIRKLIQERYRGAYVSEVNIERPKEDRVSIVIRSARPGIIIGRGGNEITAFQAVLEKLTGREVKISIAEVERPDFEAILVAQDVAMQIEGRTAPNRAMKDVIRRVRAAGALGVKIECSGRLDGAEIARSLKMMDGRVPLQTIRADIDYGVCEAKTKYGNIGIKAWVFRGEASAWKGTTTHDSERSTRRR
ncbi:30S ribosomal protein S3 [Candidatus Acetothermia bacterium]|jgi:small subunit ribosomal protein S3|nr:30S ribosomal protein S3 [Candidatus Acetothermia bacterium]MCI2427605.1 30S ribosomal protein S3 [Candidatus Acetothermia bacterium]MCI2428217.1 30S ribosomal protein S3 [Candidatus Acetothermia bacterium]